MTAPKPNAELAYRVLDTVNVHRKAFNMADWFDSPDDDRVTLTDLLDEKCGTTACFAGWTIALSGYEMGGGISRNGEWVSYTYGNFAAGLLGIDNETADYLFYSDGDDIDETVAEIFGPRPGGAS